MLQQARTLPGSGNTFQNHPKLLTVLDIWPGERSDHAQHNTQHDFELSDPVGRLRAEAEKEKAEESYGGLVLALWDFALTLFLAP